MSSSASEEYSLLRKQELKDFQLLGSTVILYILKSLFLGLIIM